MNEALERDADFESESTKRRYDSAAKRVVDALLLVDEAPLRDAIRGTSQFAADFERRGAYDRRRRSLRQLDLTTRLFRYPCSYLIYSDAFDGLPEPVHERVLRRLWDVLTAIDRSAEYRHLSAADRAAILGILRETKPGLPTYWTRN
jgi:hypothetical protein